MPRPKPRKRGAPNGLDVSHLLRYYTARGFRDEGRRIIALSL
jgi:hypothetical protein